MCNSTKPHQQKEPLKLTCQQYNLSYLWFSLILELTDLVSSENGLELIWGNRSVYVLFPQGRISALGVAVAENAAVPFTHQNHARVNP